MCINYSLKYIIIIACVFLFEYTSAQISWNKKTLVYAKDQFEQLNPLYLRAGNIILDEASKICGRNNSYSVVKKVIPKDLKIDQHTYLSLAPYYWPNTKTKSGLPYIRKDGKTNPEVNTVSDLEELRRLSKDLRILSLAYTLTGKSIYSNRAEVLLKAWFLDSRTMMYPNFDFSQIVKGNSSPRNSGIVDGVEFIEIINSINLFENSLNANTILGLRKWFIDYFNWLESKKYDVNSHTNNIGTSYYLQIFVISKFLKPEADVEKYLAPMLNLLNSQFDSNGRQKEEIVRNKGVNYSLLNISYWISINNILEGNSKYKNYNYEISKKIRNGILFLEKKYFTGMTSKNKFRINNLKNFLGLKTTISLNKISKVDDALSIYLNSL